MGRISGEKLVGLARHCAAAQRRRQTGRYSTPSARVGHLVSKKLQNEYMSMIGALIYAVPSCRADVTQAVGVLARALTFPTESMFLAAQRVLVLSDSLKLGLEGSLMMETSKEENFLKLIPIVTGAFSILRPDGLYCLVVPWWRGAVVNSTVSRCLRRKQKSLPPQIVPWS